MQKVKKILKAFLCLLKPRSQEFTLEQFMKIEAKKVIKKPIQERKYYEE